MAAKQMNKSGKHKVMKVGRDGKRRAYWVGQGPNAQRKGGLRNAGPDGAKPGFLARHGKKIAAGVAISGAALLANHMLKKRFNGEGLTSVPGALHGAYKKLKEDGERAVSDHRAGRTPNEQRTDGRKRTGTGTASAPEGANATSNFKPGVSAEFHHEGPHVFGGSGNMSARAWGAGAPEKKKSFGRRMLEGARNSLRRSKA